MNELNKEQLKEMMESVAKRVVEAEPYLTEIDLKIGDGDHGTGMKRGFLAVERMLETFYPRSCEEVFQAVGRCIGCTFWNGVYLGHCKTRGKRYLLFEGFCRSILHFPCFSKEKRKSESGRQDYGGCAGAGCACFERRK